MWNMGAFIFRVRSILNAVKRFETNIFDSLKDLNKISESYAHLPDISIDYAIMERADNIYCVKGNYFWQDMGSFDSLRVILRQESRRFITEDGRITKIL